MVPTIGAGGPVRTMTTLADGAEGQPTEFVTIKLYVPGPKLGIVVLVPVPVIEPGLIVQVPDPGRPFNITLPVATTQVGCVIVPTEGAAGVAGCASMTTFPDDPETHPDELATV